MSIVHKFLEQLKNRGLRIEGPNANDPPETLRLRGPVEEQTPSILKALKTFKPELVKLYGRQPALPDVPTDARPDAISGAVETRGESFGQR